MRLRAGIDLVEVDEVRGVLAAQGDRYLRRVYTAQEREAAGGRPERLAAAFAGKEAVLKALDHPTDAVAVWHEVEVERNGVRLHGRLASEHQGTAIALSTSLSDRIALAVAVVERAEG